MPLPSEHFGASFLLGECLTAARLRNAAREGMVQTVRDRGLGSDLYVR